VSATREQVYQAIDGERDYQERRWGAPGGTHSNLEFLVYIRDYVEEAMHRLSREADDQVRSATQESMRKIAALAVAAQEANGVCAR
jgi:hypothetical protein